ncbi:proline-rich protein 12 isoform X3 [Anguilla anguilla]|nr:proline-rich protein 12 isoform X3 [Anguilla anguilla]
MEDCLHASSEDLSKLVSWAHSHGTICALIPNLKHLLTEGAHGNLTAMWGCSAGHAYHWPLSATCRTGPKERACYQDSRSAGSDSLSMQGGSGTQASPGDRFPGRGGASKGKGDCGQTRDSCDFSNCSEPSEADDNAEDYGGNLFDMVYESSATDEDADYEPRLQSAAECHALRKRGAPGAAPGQPCRPRPEEAPGEAAVKKIKQEAQEDYYIVAHGQLGGGADGGGGAAHSPKQPCQRAALSQAALLRPSDADPASARASPSGNPAARPPRAPPLPGSQTRPPPATAQPPSRPDPLPRPPGGPPCCGPNHASNVPLLTPPRLAGHGEPSDVPPGEELAKSCCPAPLPYGDPDTSPACLNSDLEIISTQALGAEPKSEASAPPALFEIERLKGLLQAERSRSELMGETINSLKQDKELLQQELTKKAELICEFLQEQFSNRPEKRRGQTNRQQEPSGSRQHVPMYSDETPAFESPALFDSFDEIELHQNERPKIVKNPKRNREGENTRVRMKNVVGVIARYMTALQEFRRSVSMKVAFDRVGVDRNTISRTAAIAELSLAAPEVFHSLPPWDEKEETLAHYSCRCRQAMDDTIKAKIKAMKAKGELLPIASK